MNKILRGGLAGVAACVICTAGSVCAGDYAYLTNESGGIVITGYSGAGGVVSTPQTIEGRPVVGLGEGVFHNCASLTELIIGEGVTNIGANAFGCCSALASVTIPDGVACIEHDAFYSCQSLVRVTIPDSVAEIGPCAFASCNGLSEVTIGSGISVMGEAAFYWCASLTNVTLRGLPSSVVDFSGTPGVLSLSRVFDGTSYRVAVGDGVAAIGDHAFGGCAGMTAIAIGAGVRRVGDFAFSGCGSLAAVALPAGVTNIGMFAFSSCSSLAEVTIPEGVVAIGDCAFGMCRSLRRVTVPDSVARIGCEAFVGCEQLGGVTVGAGIVSMGVRAFGGCGSVTNVTLRGLPKSVVEYSGTPGSPSLCRVFESQSFVAVVEGSATNIGSYAFEGCAGLTSVVVCAGVTNVGEYAFAECQNLLSVTIEEGLVSIGDFAFRGCSGLTCIAIPASVTGIGVGFFSWCSHLAAIVVAEESTHFESLDGVLMNKGKTLLIQWPGGKKGAFTVPASVSQIADYAFANYVGPVSLYFAGDAPSVGANTFNIDGLWVYYSSRANGWGAALGGYPTTLWNPQVLSGSVGVTEEGFGFVISNAGSPAVVVEACTNLSGTAWAPLSTNVLSDGTASFRDSEWSSHPSRFYRFRMP